MMEAHELGNVIVTATVHSGLQFESEGLPVELAFVDKAGRVLAIGDSVARTVEAVAVESYRSYLKGTGVLRCIRSSPCSREIDVSSDDGL